jgi:hypothetical protein
MGDIRKNERDKLIAGFLFTAPEKYQSALARLKDKYGPVDFESDETLFAHSDYYEGEMGKGIRRRFVSFEKLVEPLELADAKVFSNLVEAEHYWPGTTNRSVNIDPGLISLPKLVLASTKNFPHRIYIGKGIFAEVTLKYSSKEGFVPWEWTYPDYGSAEYRKIFEKIRDIYKKQL